MKLIQLISPLVIGFCVLLGSGNARADFTDPTIISSDSCNPSSYPDIVEGPDGRLHALWSCMISCTSCSDFQGNIRYSFSDDGGETWSAPRYLTNSYGSFHEYRSPRLTVGKDDVLHLTYHYINYYGSSTVYYARSSDNGQTWSQQYVQSGCFVWYPDPTADIYGNVFMAWNMWQCRTSNYQVLFRRSLDNGLTWSTPSQASLGRLISSDQSWVNGLLVDNIGQLHLLATNMPGRVANLYLISSDKGTTWSMAENIPQGFSIKGVSLSGNTLLIPGEYNSSSAILSSADNGASWQGPFTVANYLASNIELVTDKGSTYYARLDSAVFRSNDSGVTWGKPSSLTGGWMFGKMIVTRKGDLLTAGMTGSQVGIVKYVQRDEPAIVVDHESLGFGSIELPGSSMHTVTISNTGNATLMINSISITGANAAEFSQTNNCSTVAPNASCTANVTFAPTSLGAKSATLRIASNDPDTLTVDVPLTGTGVDTIPPNTTSTISGRKGDNDWYVSDVSIALTATDSGSGVKEIHYTVDGAETVVSGSTASFTISAEGEHSVAYFGVDNANNRETAHPLSVKIDKTSPVVSLSASPGILWPPNHKMVNIIPVISLSDNLDLAPQVKLLSVTSSEPDNGLGDGDTANDIVINSDGTISLRAERSGKGNGRVYTITYQATDAAGNSATAMASVTVPHSR